MACCGWTYRRTRVSLHKLALIMLVFTVYAVWNTHARIEKTFAKAYITSWALLIQMLLLRIRPRSQPNAKTDLDIRDELAIRSLLLGIIHYTARYYIPTRAFLKDREEASTSLRSRTADSNRETPPIHILSRVLPSIPRARQCWKGRLGRILGSSWSFIVNTFFYDSTPSWLTYFLAVLHPTISYASSRNPPCREDVENPLRDFIKRKLDWSVRDTIPSA